jgi:alkylation response protein AidB-like acyl-CoA dehydrogenase
MEMFDAMKMSAGKRAALDVAESARESDWKFPSFVAQLFEGKFDWKLLHPYPAQSAEDKKIGDEFCAKMEIFLKENLDPDEVDRTGLIPDKVYDGFAQMGCFALKIPKEYGGQGLSQINYNRVVGMVSSYCGSTAVMLSAHQSIGVPQPLKLFGTPEQKKKYLPRFAGKYISAFALTEPEVGSDPAKMSTMATPTEDGQHFLINGLKLWCTNGPIADILIVMAQTPPKMIKGKERKQITAFIVEKSMPGIKVLHRCSFMGLHGIQNGLIKFENVKVPRENILSGEGQGLKLALVTLNTGRLTVPAATSAMAKLCVKIVREWSVKRTQWGAEIGKHEAVSSKIATMAANTFAMEAVTWYVSAVADSGKTDMRLEAAMSKLFCTEHAWRIADDTVQIRGGRGYETADSLRARGGEDPIPAERILRDTRINLIIEGTSDIMHLFIAREAMDWHLRLASPLFGKASLGVKFGAFLKMAAKYALWYPKLWIWPNGVSSEGVPSKLKAHLRASERLSRRLARNMFHAMMIHQAKLERRQNVLARLVDIGTDIFAMSCAIAHASHLARVGGDAGNSVDLCDLFCRQARSRIERALEDAMWNDDDMVYKVGRDIFDGKFEWIENGIVK